MRICAVSLTCFYLKPPPEPCQARARTAILAGALRRGARLVFAAVALAAAPTDAQTLRCNGAIIDTGMIAAEVLAKCGEPVSGETRTEPVYARRVNGGTHLVGTTTIELWVYQRGPGQFQAQLTFEENRLAKIEYLDRQ